MTKEEGWGGAEGEGRKEADKPPASGQGQRKWVARSELPAPDRAFSVALVPTLHLAMSSEASRPRYPDLPSRSPGRPPAASGALQLSFSFPSLRPPPNPNLPHIFLLPPESLLPSHYPDTLHTPATPSSNYNPTKFPHPLNARKKPLLCARQRLKPSRLHKSTVSHGLTSEVGTSTVVTLRGRSQRHSKAERSA